MAVERVSSNYQMKSLTGEEIRAAFLNFYEKRAHKVLPSASLVPDDPTVLLTIAGMLPFKPVFLGHVDRPSKRATTSQKCIRTNDIDNVGKTARHHTFFEMLGNFSFGDYFKKEAIQWAWELSTQVFGLDPKNLVVSVFREDTEAEEIWRDEVGVDPSRIIRMDESDNFWSSGPTGPCGPCSELYYDFHPELGDLNIDLEDDNRFIEFYNLVFMQYNRNADGGLTPLANCNIDTGMGLERMAQILQGVPNNYETDLIFPLLEKVASLIEVDYQALEEKKKISLKIIGDHTRACVQLISDGVSASNLGRGYVLRRLLRRVVRHGRLLGINKPFLIDIAEVAIELVKASYPQVLERQEYILKELQREEVRFLETLERGEKLLNDLLASKPKQISGEQAFELYDTYGFPVELTEEIADEHSLKVDLKGFQNAMNQQRQRAKDAVNTIDLTLQDAIEKVVDEIGETSFCGYNKLDQQGKIKAIVVNGVSASKCNVGDKIDLVLDATPFYGEGGGQIGDAGIITGITSDSLDTIVEVDNVRRIKGAFVHSGVVQSGKLHLGDVVEAKVNRFNRKCAQSNHTATHLLQAALKQIVDSEISQAGSLVGVNRLRFDFHASEPVSSTQLEQVENLINSWITEAHSLIVSEMKIDEAKSAGAVAMFGEKYGETVRVVDVPGVSMELCGGTHVANTAEIGVFKIISESGIASGIRRIEAIAGQGVLNYLNERESVVKRLTSLFKAQSNEVVDRVIALQTEVKALNKLLIKAQNDVIASRALTLVDQVISIRNSQYLIKRLDGMKGDSLQSMATRLLDHLGSQSAILLGGTPDPKDSKKVILVAAFGKDLIEKGLHAGKFLAPIAKLCGGGGGGRPDLAQAGGRDAKTLDSALEFANKKLIELLS
ncbi:alanine--tRNA ligase [Prochlorococcus marinus]|uniref:alanine--tRNA ligase n=1 Tax=Prochlorococcus marinus TaxID=1219 RepID=UPI0022B45DF0|nr:alanine--tRNA ligase [Prochlorococcus marinus]